MIDQKMIEQQINILRKDVADGMRKLYEEVGQTLARLATNIAKEQDALEKRVRNLETADETVKLRDPSTEGREL